MTFIGREKELRTLNDNYARNSSFVVIYGRRRVGKTTLITEFIKNKPALYFLATEEVESQNLRRFTDSLADFTGQTHLKSAVYTDWLVLLRLFADHNPNEKKILIIDEFQYLVQTNAAFPSILQKAWDELLQNHNIMIILCGSYIRMMTTHTLSRSSPLYGRRTAQILLKPLRFTELAGHYTTKTFTELVELYALTSGVPKYLEFFDNNDGTFENIRKHILNTNGFLYEEPIYLLEKEVKEPISYLSIMKAIALGNHKLSQIAGVLELKANVLSPYLATLIDLGLVERRIPATEKHPEKSRRGLYIIKDTFIRFWFLFVYPNKGELERDRIEPTLEKIQKEFIQQYLGFIYEDICKELFLKLCDEKKIDISPQTIGSYWNPNSSIEIDVIGINHDTKQLFAGECKYYTGKKQINSGIYQELRNKCRNPDLKDYHITYGLFTPTGFDHALVKIAENQQDLILIKEMNRI